MRETAFPDFCIQSHRALVLTIQQGARAERLMAHNLENRRKFQKTRKAISCDFLSLNFCINH